MSALLVAVIGGLAVALGFASSVLGLLNQRAARRTEVKVQEVHVLVNSKLTAWIDRSGQLIDALQGAGVQVPPAPTRTTPDPPAPPAVTPGS